MWWRRSRWRGGAGGRDAACGMRVGEHAYCLDGTHAHAASMHRARAGAMRTTTSCMRRGAATGVRALLSRIVCTPILERGYSPLLRRLLAPQAYGRRTCRLLVRRAIRSNNPRLGPQAALRMAKPSAGRWVPPDWVHGRTLLVHELSLVGLCWVRAPACACFSLRARVHGRIPLRKSALTHYYSHMRNDCFRVGRCVTSGTTAAETRKNSGRTAADRQTSGLNAKIIGGIATECVTCGYVTCLL